MAAAYTFLVLHAVTGAHGFNIEEATVESIQQGFGNGSLTSVQLVRFYLDRIEGLNPLLRAVIEVNPDALRQAAHADAERLRSSAKCLAGGAGGLLHGVPVLLKDNIATRDALNTTARSFALLGSVPLRDAVVVSRLRHADAAVLGKANMDEWANFCSLLAQRDGAPVAAKLGKLILHVLAPINGDQVPYGRRRPGHGVVPEDWSGGEGNRCGRLGRLHAWRRERLGTYGEEGLPGDRGAAGNEELGAEL